MVMNKPNKHVPSIKQSPPTVAEAEAAINRLEQRRSELVARGDQLATNRASFAYAALNDDDATAKAKLDEIGRETVEHDHQLASVDAALKTAQERLASAKRAEARAQDREQALLLRQALTAFIEAGKGCDAALELLVTASTDLRNTVTTMNRLGVTHPSHAQLDALGSIALRTALTDTAWVRYFERVSPVERKRFSDLVAAWAATVERSIQQRLGEQSNNKHTGGSLDVANR
jgi:hypothetical protein